MPYNSATKRDFLTSLAIFHNRYLALFRLISAYPTSLIDRPGLAGNLSPRQAIARLGDRLQAAEECFANFDNGINQDEICDSDSDVMYITAFRESLDWASLCSELRNLTQDVLTHAVAADTQMRAGDARYRKWLIRLSDDCTALTHQLETFAGVDHQR